MIVAALASLTFASALAGAPAQKSNTAGQVDKTNTATAAPGFVLTDALGRPIARIPNVLVFPTVTFAGPGGSNDVGEIRLRAFSEGFASACRSVFDWRRWRSVAGGEAVSVLEDIGRNGRCTDATCVDLASAHVSATHWITSVLVAVDERDCRVRVKMFDLVSRKVTFDQEQPIAPCLTDNLLAAAADLGRAVAQGPRAPERIDLELTSLTVPSIDIPDIADVPTQHTSTTARAASGFKLERALDVYRKKHMFTFIQDDHLYVVRDGKLLNDCELLKVASLPATDAQQTHCDGNYWEIAWGGLPLGGLLMFAGSDGFSSGNTGDVALLMTGVGTVLASTVLALLLDEDAAEPGQHILSRGRIAGIVRTSNASLRKALALSDSEVTIAGMRH